MMEIAQAARVSQSTVSNVLNGRGSISLKTRKKVLQTAERLRYRPNLFAAGLRSYRNRNSIVGWPIVVLVHHRRDGSWYPNEPLLESLRATTTQSNGFIVQEQVFHDFDELPRLSKMLFARGARGMVINSQEEIESSGIDWSRFSVVTCGRWNAPSRFHNVRGDIFSGVTRLWKEMEKNGYEEIGAAPCRHPVPLPDDFEREGAVYAMQARLRKGIRRIPPFLGDHGDWDGFLAWFRKCRPSAVIGFSDIHYEALKGAGCCIPDECAYASMQGTRFFGEVAGCAETQSTMGKRILRLMDGLIRHHEMGVPEYPETMLVAPDFLSGASLPAKALL